MSQGTRIFVKDFGAKPGDSNTVAGIMAAFSKAANVSGPKTVVFEKGIYDLHVPGGDTVYALIIRNTPQLTLEGNGATLRIRNPSIGGLVVSGCKDVAIKGLRIDYLPVPFTQGVVRSVDLDKNTFSVSVDNDFPEPDLAWFVAARTPWAVTVRETSAGGGTNWGPIAIPYTLLQKTGEREWSFEAKGNATGYRDALKAAKLQVGERMVLHARNWASAFTVQFSENALVEDVVIHTSPGLAFFPYLSTNVTMRRCHVERPAGTKRQLSACADGIHPRGLRGTLRIEDCSFEAMTDDAISIHSYPVSIVSQESAGLVTVKAAHVSFQPGDLLDLVSMKTGAVAGTPRVKAVEKLGALTRLTLEGLPSGDFLSPGYFIYSVSETPEKTIITGCTFGNFRGRGILLRGRDTLIQNNTFRMAEGWGVSFWTYLGKHPEAGPIPARVRIVDNTFYGVGGTMGAIMSRYPNGEKPVARSIQSVEITGNRFIDPVTPVVDFEGVSGILISGNEVLRSKEWKSQLPTAWFMFDNCDGIRLEKNKIDDRVKGVASAVLLGSSVPKGEAGYAAKENTFKMNGGELLKDER